MVGVDLYKIEVDLSKKEEQCAEEIYKRLRQLPKEVKKNLQMIINDIPLTKSLKEDYSMADGD